MSSALRTVLPRSGPYTAPLLAYWKVLSDWQSVVKSLGPGRESADCRLAATLSAIQAHFEVLFTAVAAFKAPAFLFCMGLHSCLEGPVPTATYEFTFVPYGVCLLSARQRIMPGYGAAYSHRGFLYTCSDVNFLGNGNSYARHLWVPAIDCFHTLRQRQASDDGIAKSMLLLFGDTDLIAYIQAV